MYSIRLCAKPAYVPYPFPFQRQIQSQPCSSPPLTTTLWTDPSPLPPPVPTALGGPAGWAGCPTRQCPIFVKIKSWSPETDPVQPRTESSQRSKLKAGVDVDREGEDLSTRSRQKSAGKGKICQSVHGQGKPMDEPESPRTDPSEPNGKAPLVHRQEQWNARFRELENYKAEHGNCSVPQKLGTLGGWVNSQRTARNSGTLPEERVRKLDEIGFNWGTARGRRGTPQSWDERLGELMEYKAEHGNCNIPQSQGSLGKWVDNQRHQKRKGKLSEERVRKLVALGFEFCPHKTLPTWDERLVELVQYKAE